MIEPTLTRTEQIRLARIEEMKRIWIHCPDRNRSLWELSETEGIKARVEYVCNVGRPTHEVLEPWIIEKKRHNLGLIFGNGLETKGVDEKHFNFFKEVERVERWERI